VQENNNKEAPLLSEYPSKSLPFKLYPNTRDHNKKESVKNFLEANNIRSPAPRDTPTKKKKRIKKDQPSPSIENICTGRLKTKELKYHKNLIESKNCNKQTLFIITLP
jgi:hypothetical protein